MEWLKTTYIRQQGLKSKKAAVICSRDHWRQLYAATPKELKEQYLKDPHLLWSENCALCHRYANAETRITSVHCERHNCCPMGYCDPHDDHYSSLWAIALAAFDEWRDTPNQKHWRRWKRACKPVLDKLEEAASKYESPERR